MLITHNLIVVSLFQVQSSNHVKKASPSNNLVPWDAWHLGFQLQDQLFCHLLKQFINLFRERIDIDNVKVYNLRRRHATAHDCLKFRSTVFMPYHVYFQIFIKYGKLNKTFSYVIIIGHYNK
jgi:hypothetical protein